MSSLVENHKLCRCDSDAKPVKGLCGSNSCRGLNRNGEAQQWPSPADETSSSNFPQNRWHRRWMQLIMEETNRQPEFVFCFAGGEERFDVFSEKKISPGGANSAPN